MLKCTPNKKKTLEYIEHGVVKCINHTMSFVSIQATITVLNCIKIMDITYHHVPQNW